jgi:hypothetical protein
MRKKPVAIFYVYDEKAMKLVLKKFFGTDWMKKGKTKKAR